jgi:alpha-N-arabinofuranosidase
MYAIALAVLLIGLNPPLDGTAPLLRNPGFEAENVVDGWEMVVYGEKADVAADENNVKEGRRALRVTATVPSDVALGQEVTVRPRQWYRFTGSVKTRGLDPMGAPVCGTFQVQRAGGKGVLAGGPSHRGDTEWSTVSFVFQAPADGRVRIAPFLVGYGKGRGTAWFDGLALDEIDPARSAIVVTRDALRPGRIAPEQYGQFVEYLCDVVPSMWADKLCDGSFEGLTPYKVAYLKETDFREHPWYPSGATNRAQFERDSSTKVSGEVSYKIAAEPGAPSSVGVSQSGIAVQKNLVCRFSCFLRQSGVKGAVRIRLHHEGTTYASAELQPTGNWQKYEARLTPSATDNHVTLTVEFRGPGTLWLDNARLVPEDNVGGWRRDVVEAVRAMKPAIIRFGGSALDDPNLGDFEWRDTIGDPDHRRPFRAWGGLQPTGAGLEEFVQFCRLVGAEPLICVRVTRRTPQDAADQVQYMNGSAETPMGALRARNGHPEPYRVRYWQVGNEQGGREYEKRLPDFCRAIKQADPSIQLLASYPSAGVLEGSAEWLDFVAPHHYDCANLASTEAGIESIRGLIREHGAAKKIRIAVTEWNTTAGDWGPRRARLWTLENALACSRYHNLIHRHCDIVAIANRSNLINSFCSGCIQTDNHRLYTTPTYQAQKLYATLAGDRALRIESALPANTAPDLSATLSSSSDAVVLLAVNDGLDPIMRPLDLSAFGKDGQDVEIWTLTDTKHAVEPDVTNSFGDPERVVPVRSTFRAPSPKFDYSFGPLSLTVLRWRVGNVPQSVKR